ncbi:MAG: excalibur calcium-binding domain-containing protein [Candidatus Microthrix sp.]|jgi:hypothetical protein|nr:excalibur calcium-binding domain-containing protein [Candidatus Microthrix sp.]MBK6438517.1 excalibur calcium-binding domain-containing protein [Candidatus Microthrix sp.]MBK6969120.1 excalibur calcium-binding domain-containing protein [Candidatus Microthrix sp.]MBK7165768.1 excalibur calcium-binding domain-containing protein [Candidatus Microthrix sp.]MBP7405733.1 excalibur calcium-binding domain-containing protein [Candidatus Microthrix sp.]MBP9066330.1 excalibur calcium-binding domain-co
MKKLGLAAMLLGATTLGLTSCEFKTCTQLNKSYPHGVGRPGAVDRTSGSPRVTTFHRDANLYKLNARLDRDKDNIACEKR